MRTRAKRNGVASDRARRENGKENQRNTFVKNSQKNSLQRKNSKIPYIMPKNYKIIYGLLYKKAGNRLPKYKLTRQKSGCYNSGIKGA